MHQTFVNHHKRSNVVVFYLEISIVSTMRCVIINACSFYSILASVKCMYHFDSIAILFVQQKLLFSSWATYTNMYLVIYRWIDCQQIFFSSFFFCFNSYLHNDWQYDAPSIDRFNAFCRLRRLFGCSALSADNRKWGYAQFPKTLFLSTEANKFKKIVVTLSSVQIRSCVGRLCRGCAISNKYYCFWRYWWPSDIDIINFVLVALRQMCSTIIWSHTVSTRWPIWNSKR